MIYHTFNGYKPKTIAEKSNRDAVQADLRIKYCPKCRKCYETDQQATRNTGERSNVYYDDFVSYGKDKVICERCEAPK